MVEGVILLPVLAILWLGVRYLAEVQHASALARLEARRCAWQHALHGCETPPPGCNAAVERQQTAVPGAPDLAADVRAQAGPLPHDPFTSIPVLGDALAALFGTTTHARLDREVASPFSSEPVRVSATFVVLCNEQPRTASDVARTAFCEVTGLCH
jgi:hypothetical protein